MSSKLKLQPPQKHVDKSQKQQFIVEFPSELTQSLGSVAYVNIDRKHFLPPVLLTGIAKQQKEEKGKTPVVNPIFQGELSIQVLSREDKEITFEKCERCQEKDSHIFPLFEKIDAPEEKEHQHPRNCFALIGCDKVQFEKGKAIIPVYFRCCPTHHTSKKGENFVRMRVRIVKSPNVVFESDFMQVQWKKGKHNRVQVKGTPSSPCVVPQPCVNSISSIVNANSNRESAFVPNPSNLHSANVPSSNTNNTSPPIKPTTHQLPPLSSSPSTTISPVVPTPTKPTPSSTNNNTSNNNNNNNNNNMLQLPSLLNKEPNTNTATTTTTTTTTSSTTNSPANPFMLNPLQNNPISNIMNNTGVPPYQAYMNMFQHLQTYYVQPLEEENKKLRQELSDITRSLAGLKEENRKLTDNSITMHSTRDVNFLDQLKYYQYEIDCNPSFLSYDDDEEMLPEEEKEEFEANHIRPYGRRTMREAIKFMKFKSNVKLVLLKHNGTQWFEPLDRRNTSTYLDGERFGIRIINKNTFPVYVRLHKITSFSTSQNIPLSDEDFLRIEGCEQENKWEPTYFDLGTVNYSENTTSEPVELMKLLVTTNGNKFGGEKLSVILTKSYVITKKTL